MGLLFSPQSLRGARAVGVASLALASLIGLSACSGQASEDERAAGTSSPASSSASGAVSSAPATASAPQAQASGTPSESSEAPQELGAAPSESDVPENASTPSGPPPTAKALEREPGSTTTVDVDAQDRVRRSMGQAGVLTLPGSDTVGLRVTVSGVDFKEGCTMRGFGNSLAPQHGRFAAVRISASLSEREKGRTDLSSRSFVPLDAHGNPLAADAWSEEAEACETSPVADVALYPGDSTRGTLILDVPAGTERIAFDVDGSPGWSWPVR